MPSLWIIHREPRFRSALARLTGAGADYVQAAPGDPQLDTAAPADRIVLGLTGNFEVELQFAHRFAPRFPAAHWILVAAESEVARARSLFDTLDCSVFAYPPEPRDLRASLQAPRSDGPRNSLPLSRRPARDALSSRFARWFADLELPELLRILDPHRAEVPLLIYGETGTGRGLLARYVHTFGGGLPGEFVHVPCSGDAGPHDLLAAVVRASGTRGNRAPRTIWLENVDRLPHTTQCVVAGWVEFAPPDPLGCAGLRWIGSAGGDDAALENGLRTELGAFTLRIPPLRERGSAIAAFAIDTAHAWCERRRERTRRFGEDAIAVLEDYPWPGNLRELEGVVIQTLLASNADPIRADDLQRDGLAFAPLSAEPLGSDFGTDDAADEIEPIAGLAAPAAVDPAPLSSEAGTETAGIRRLAGAVAHEVRNPLTTIRTFAELLPDQYQDSEFREQFTELVGRDAERIEAVVSELAQLAALPPPGAEPVDSTRLLEELLEERRDPIQDRKLLVLKEFDWAEPLVLGDSSQLRLAFEALLDKCIEITPERGDLYFASKHHAAGLHGCPSVRVLIRFHGPRDEPAPPATMIGLSPGEHALEFAIAGVIVHAHGGAFTVQTGEGGETVLVLELPAPA
jgi:DNA-binding NtrC family response regulator